MDLQSLALPTVNSTRSRTTQFDARDGIFAYCSGQNVIVQTPSKLIVYADHKFRTTCVKIAPSGNYACSGDSAGFLNIFDLVGEDNVTILSQQVLSNVIYDLAWDHESQRIIVVGFGKDEFARCFLVKSGASIGSISGHSAPILSCDFRGKRPFRVVTGGEDGISNLYKGPPFNFPQSILPWILHQRC
ncbi:hypothetical protein GEMRC1_006912 [Eukaryota sp. GEM-RC1]